MTTVQMKDDEVTNLFGYRIASRGVASVMAVSQRIIDEQLYGNYVVCANPHSLIVAESDLVFERSLRQASIILPDGAGVALALKVLGGRTVERVTGSDLFQGLLHLKTQRPLRVFFLGSSDQVLEMIKTKVAQEFPEVVWAGSYSPPYVPVFSVADNQAMTAQINAAQPDVLFVGMTAPKQEKWIFENREQLKVPMMCAIGAVFDYYAGNIHRPQWAAALGIEWLVRLAQEPRRLWKRTFVSMPKFLLKVVAERLAS